MKFALLVNDPQDLNLWESSVLDFLRNQESISAITLIRLPYQTPNTLASKIFKLQYKVEKRLDNLKNSIESFESINTTIIEFSEIALGGFHWVLGFNIEAQLLEEVQTKGFPVLDCHTPTHLVQSRNIPEYFEAIIQKEPRLHLDLTLYIDHRSFVLGTSAYNLHWSGLKNQAQYIEQSIHLLQKVFPYFCETTLAFSEFQNLDHQHRAHVSPTQNTSAETYLDQNINKQAPTGLQSLYGSYFSQFYSRLLQKPLRKIFQKITPRRYNCWHLFLGQGHILDQGLSQVVRLDLPKNEFWADPFLFEHTNQKGQDELWVFFENYSYSTHLGKISAARIENQKVEEVIDILDTGSHLSYPQIFRQDGEIFMIPETCAKHRIEVYKCTKFPDQWELYSTAFEGEVISDTTYYQDENQQGWLFVNKGYGGQVNAELFIYKISSLQFETITPHTQNPVIIDSRSGRNAGSLFRLDNKLYRPAQNNSNGIYGYGLGIYKINKLSLDEFNQSLVREFEPNFTPGIFSTHHVHQLGGQFIVDAAYPSIR